MARHQDAAVTANGPPVTVVVPDGAIRGVVVTEAPKALWLLGSSGMREELAAFPGRSPRSLEGASPPPSQSP